MATKRKVKKLAGGFGEDDFAGVDEAVARNADSGEWARGENYGDNTTGDERVAMARAPAREASAEEVMAANKFAASPRPRPAAPRPVAQAVKEVKADVAAQQAANKSAASSGPRVGRASQATVDRAPRNQPTAEGLKSMRAQDAEQRSDFANSRLMRGLRSIFSTPKTRGGSSYAGGGSASSRADGIAKRGKTRGKVY